MPTERTESTEVRLLREEEAKQERERRIQEALLDIKKKYGKNAKKRVLENYDEDLNNYQIYDKFQNLLKEGK